jgi:hypothetical protein
VYEKKAEKDHVAMQDRASQANAQLRLIRAWQTLAR